MSERKWKLLLSSPVGCRIMAVVTFGICIFAVIYNVYNSLDGDIDSVAEIASVITGNEIAIFLMGAYFFGVFMYAAHNAQKDKKGSKSKRNVNKGKNVSRKESRKEEEDSNSIVNALRNSKWMSYTMGYDRYKITFRVPTAFEWTDDSTGKVDEESGLVFAPRLIFQSDSPSIRTGIVDCIYTVDKEEDIASGDYTRAQEEIQDNWSCLTKSERGSSTIRNIVINGRKVHYYITYYKEGLDKYQSLYAVCEVEQGKLFELNCVYDSWKPELSIKDFEGFFHFEGEMTYK